MEEAKKIQIETLKLCLQITTELLKNIPNDYKESIHQAFNYAIADISQSSSPTNNSDSPSADNKS